MTPLRTVKTRRGFRHGFRSVGANDEWLTPLSIIRSLGPFDLDPCAPVNRPWPTAAHQFTIDDDGLFQPWFGRVWLNPPYSSASPWLERLADHGDGIALIFARTETRWFFAHVWQRASAVFFFKRRIAFCSLDGSVGNAARAPSCLVAYSDGNLRRIRKSGIDGKLILLERDLKESHITHVPNNRVKLSAASSDINPLTTHGESL